MIRRWAKDRGICHAPKAGEMFEDMAAGGSDPLSPWWVDLFWTVYSVLPVASSESRLVLQAFCLKSSTHVISHVTPKLGFRTVQTESPGL